MVIILLYYIINNIKIDNQDFKIRKYFVYPQRDTLYSSPELDKNITFTIKQCNAHILLFAKLC